MWELEYANALYSCPRRREANQNETQKAEMPRLSGLKTSTLLLVTQTFAARFILD